MPFVIPLLNPRGCLNFTLVGQPFQIWHFVRFVTLPALLSYIGRMQRDATAMAVGVKALRQTPSSDNPYVDIHYSAYIQIDER